MNVRPTTHRAEVFARKMIAYLPQHRTKRFPEDARSRAIFLVFPG
jgi:hypothetical protein